MAKTQNMRGLAVRACVARRHARLVPPDLTLRWRCTQNFISEIRSCQNKEQEMKRVDKELANIRAKFGDTSGLSRKHT